MLLSGQDSEMSLTLLPPAPRSALGFLLLLRALGLEAGSPSSLRDSGCCSRHGRIGEHASGPESEPHHCVPVRLEWTSPHLLAAPDLGVRPRSRSKQCAFTCYPSPKVSVSKASGENAGCRKLGGWPRK